MNRAVTSKTRVRAAAAASRFVAMDAFVAKRLAALPSAPTAPALAPTPAADNRGDPRIGCDLTVGTGLEAALRYGWHVPERWGAWTSAKDAVLALTVGRRPARPLVFELMLAASSHAPLEHACRIVVGRNTIASIEFWPSPISLPLRVRVEPHQISPDGELDLHLVVGASFRSADRVDKREFGVALERVRLLGEMEDMHRVASLAPGAVITPETGLKDAVGVGWYSADGDRIWTASKRALLRLGIHPALRLPHRLELGLSGLSPADRTQTATIAFGGRIAARHSFKGAALERVSAWLTHADVSDDGTIEVGIMVDALYAPADIGRGHDSRPLGVALFSIQCDSIVHADRRQLRPHLAVGDCLAFGRGLEHSLVSGWNHLEAWGAWTSVADALIALRLVADGTRPLRLLFHLTGASPPSVKQNAALVAAGQVLAALELTADRSGQLIEIVVPADAISPEGDLDVILHVDQRFSPSHHGGDDLRSLGAGLRSITYVG